MTQLFGLCLLWLGLLLVRFSRELSQDISRTRRLCGSHLLKEIVTLCGRTNWSQFQLEGTPAAQLTSQASRKVKTFNPDHFRSSRAPSQVGGRVTNPASTTISQEEATNSWETQSLPEYQYKKANWLPKKTREFSSSHDVNPYIHESPIFQKKSTNKMKTLHNLFWGNHPQRKRRGYSDKCCLKGCTREELAIACLPYIES